MSETLNLLKDFDEVWMVPCGDRPDKALRTPGPQRLEMCNIAVKEFFPKNFPIKVKDTEIINGEFIPTYYLLEKYEKEFKDQMEFYFVMGTDLIPTLRQWHEGDKLMELTKYVIFNRSGSLMIKDIEEMPKTYIEIDH